MPAVSPVALANDPMFWQQQKEQADQVRQSARQSTNIVPLADQLMNDPGQTYQKAAGSVADIGTAATQGVIGSMQTLQQQQKEQEQKDFQQQQQDALQRLQQQQQTFYDNLKTQYASDYAAQSADQQAAWSEYYKKLDEYKTQIQNLTKNSNGSLNSTIPSASTVPLSGTEYTGQAAQIAQYARQAGFPESQIPMAVAIAMAESSGNATALNTANRNGSRDYGLMQINSIHSGLLQQYNWKDPLQNMQMAYQIWKDAGGKWTPWSTYNSGAYQQFTGIGDKAANSIQPANVKPFLTQTANGLRQAITTDAKQYLGLPYVWAGTDLSKGVDCSGLVQSVYKQFGIQLPRTADEQAHSGVKTSISNLQPGDLVAWQGGYRGPNYVGHIAIYMGNGKILEAPYTGANVRIRDIGKSENVFGVHLTNLDRDGSGFPVSVPAPIPRSSSTYVPTPTPVYTPPKSTNPAPRAPIVNNGNATRTGNQSFSW